MDIPLQLKLIFGIIGSILAIYYAVPYIIDIIKGKTQPHLYSWLVWTILQVVGSFAHFSDGGGYGSLPLAVGALSCLTILLLSFKYGTKNINRFDFICLVLSFISIYLYFIIKNPLATVILIVIADTIGFLPTMRKGFEEPYSETLSTWSISFTSNFLGLLALQRYTTVTVLYTSVLMVTNLVMFLILYFRRKIISNT
jgi:hypothetical protein